MRARAVLALVGVLWASLGAFPGTLRADEPSPPAGAPASGVEAASPKDDAITADELVRLILERPASRTAFLLIQVGGPLVGIFLLVRAWLRRDKIRGGLLPEPARATPTVPFDLPVAVGLLLLWFGGAAVLAQALVHWQPSLEGDLGFALALQTGVSLPLVAVIVLRRLRLSDPPPPRLPRALGIGAGTWFVVLVGVVPVAILTNLLLHLLGQEPTSQELVETAANPETEAWKPWAIGLYGVFVAPVLEEGLFRGTLYPAIRNALGGSRRAVWISAIVTSVLFALIHLHVASLVPLFLLAMVLAFTIERTNSLAGVMVTHGLFNFGSMLPLLLLRAGS